MNNSFYTCKFSKCNRIYDKPVTLPCGNNACQHHFDSSLQSKFQCPLCFDEHEIPKNGFSINHMLNELLTFSIHAENKEEKLASNLINNLKSVMENFKSIVNDPEAFIYDYFFEVKNKIDEKREKLKFEVDLVSDNLISQLNEFESECRFNFKTMNNANIENDIEALNIKISQWENDLKNHQMSQKALVDLTSQLNKIILDYQEKLIDHKKELLVGKGCNFVTKKYEINEKIFGELKINESFNVKLTEKIRKIGLEHSKILTNEQVFNLIEVLNFNINQDRFSLLYRATEDGFAATDFHRKCDDISPTLIIIKVKDSLNVFGGYTESAWDCSNKFKKDPRSFLFSLENKEDVMVKINQHKDAVGAIFCGENDGPTFGEGNDFRIASDSDKNLHSYSNLGITYKLPKIGNCSLELYFHQARKFLAGSCNFSTSEIEVYKLN